MAEPKTQIVTKGVITNLNKNTFTRMGNLQFIGWNTKRDGSGINYLDQQEIQISSPLTLYAQWGYKISWESNGGTEIEPMYVLDNSKIGTLPISFKDGYDLEGWYTEPAGGNKISEDTVIKQNGTYYAKWKGKVYTKTMKTISSDHGLICDTNLPNGNYDIRLEGMYVYHWGDKKTHEFHPKIQVFNANNTKQYTTIAMNGDLTPQNSEQVYIKKNAVHVGTCDGLTWTNLHWSDGIIVTNLNQEKTPKFSIEMHNIELPYKSNKVVWEVSDIQEDCGNMNFGHMPESSSQIGATITRL